MFNAQKIAARIEENVALADSGKITWAEFTARNFAAWDEVAQGEANVIGSACARRHIAVQKLIKS